MATKLFLRNTTTNGISGTGDGILYDLLTSAGAAADTSVTNTSAGGTEIQATKTAGGSTIAWISGRAPVGGFTLTTSDISLWQQESNMNANIGGRYRIFKRTAAGVITELAGGPFDDGAEMATSNQEDTWAGNPTDTAFAEDDRILIRYYLTNVGTMASGHTGTMTFNNANAATGDSFFNIAETVTFKSDPISVALTGVSVTGAAGTLGVSRGQSLTGNAAITAVGTVTPQSGDWIKGFNFRASSGYVTDGANETYVLPADAYPTTRNGVTFGYESTNGLDSRDRNSSLDPSIAGLHFKANSDTNTAVFRVDLPAAVDTEINLAIGDTGGNSQTNYLQIRDTNTPRETFSPIVTDGSHLADAGGNQRTWAAWPTDNVSITRSFTTTILRVVLGGTVGGDNSTIAHLNLQQASASSDITLALSGVSATGAAGSLGVSRDKALTGEQAAASTGSVGFLSDKALTGNAVTVGIGTLTPNADKVTSGNVCTSELGSITTDRHLVLSGNQSSTTAGTVSVDHSQSVSGVSTVCALDTAAPSLTISTTGVESSAIVGAVTVEGSSDKQAALTSVHSTTALGSVDVDRSLTLSGAEGASEIGILTPQPLISISSEEIAGLIGSVVQSVSIILNGGQVTGGAGTLFASSSLVLSGVFATGQTGSVTAESDTSLSLQLSGITATCSLGSATSQRDVSLTGTESLTELGAIGLSKSGSVVLTGVQASALAGGLTAEFSRVVDGDQAQAQIGAISLMFGVTPSGVVATGGAGSLFISTDVGLSGISVDLQLGTFLLVGSIARRKIIQVSSEGRNARVSTERRSLKVSSETRVK